VKEEASIKITLDEICEGIPKIKAVNPNFKVGFSFIITWKNAFINETNIVENRRVFRLN